MQWFLLVPLGIAVGLALGALGGGGSILAVPALVYGAGLSPRQATTTSLVIVGVASLAAAVGHWRAGNVRVGAGLWFGLAGVVGSLVGSRLNRAVDPQVLLLAFSGVMVLVAWRMWRSARSRPDAGRTPDVVLTRSRVVLGVVVAGTVVGFLTGFFGVGGGFVIVPALVLVLGFDMPVAVGTSLLVIALNSAVALAARVASTGIDWHVALPFTLAGLVGALAGGRLGRRAPAGTLARWFAVLLVVVAVYTMARSLVALS
ncbi:MAG TPA: sulfite exporter TauE/SafE family protein [Acidimicrobiales bacterium]|nr:sulfite exporter TauE/SafE family protein [Acidimicrobiales bacterium]